MVAMLCFLDPLGSGDDDEDNGLEDSSAEIENDQDYFSRGLCLVLFFCFFHFERLTQWNFSVGTKWF